MDEPTVYADGYGRWHAYIPEGRASGGILVARSLIRDELNARGEGITSFTRYVVENVCRGVQDKPGFIHFVEYHLDEDVA